MWRILAEGCLQHPSIQQNPRAAERESPGSNQSDYHRIDPMFLQQHASGQRLLGVTGVNRYTCLADDRTAIELSGHEMHADAVFSLGGLEHPAVCMQALVLRQERGMNVQYAAGIALHELRRQDAHEAGKHQQLGAVLVDGLRECGLKQRAVGKPRLRAPSSPEAWL